MSNGVIMVGTVATHLFAWKSTRAQLKLESKGLKSSGGALRPRLAASLGLRPRDDYAKYLAAVDEKIAELEAQLQPGGIRKL